MTLIITLTTDWGQQNHYIAAVKGKLLSGLPDARIVDITHEIESFNLKQGSFILSQAYSNFPKGSIHIIGINSESTLQSLHAVIFADGHYFIGADNGIFSLMFDKIDKIIHIDIPQETNYFTFPERDIFCNAAVHLAQEKDIEELGDSADKVRQMLPFQPIIHDNLIKGKVIFVDGYGNTIVNISEKLFREKTADKEFLIHFRRKEYIIDEISEVYSDVPEGEMLAIFGSSGYLELAMNRGNASRLLGIKVDSVIDVEITTPPNKHPQNSLF